MKRISVLTLLTVVAMLVFASAAFATASSTYVTWDPTAPNDDPATPHKGYAINTNKCAVCHAVHKGAPQSTGGEVLLRSNVAGACDYCHILTNIGGDRLYDGNVDAHNSPDDVGPMPGGFGHNNNCTDCHSVHGANTMNGAKSSRILYDWADPDAPNRPPYSTYALLTWPDPSSLANGDEQITAWCTGCHAYYTPYYADGTATGYVDMSDARLVGPQDDDFYQSHVMTSTGGASGVYDNGVTTQPDPVAYAASIYCVSCHDAPNSGTSVGNDPADGVYDNHFPHYTTDYYRFMQVSTSTAAPADSTNTTGTVDGLCLKCHRDNTEGVGVTY